MEELRNAINNIIEEKIIKVVISNKINKDVKYNKIGILLKEKKNKEYYQIEKFTDKQVFHENIEIDELENKLIEYIEGKYKQVNAWSENTTYDLKISKKNSAYAKFLY